MGKYDRFDKHQVVKQSGPKVHPIWRGIGCVMFILIPIVAFAAADMFYDSAADLRLLGSRIFPASGDLYWIFFSYELGENTLLRISPLHIVFTLVFSVIGFLIFSLSYAVVYRFTGPPQYGPTDAPPPRRSKKRRK